MSNLDKFAEGLQSHIMKDLEKTYSKKVIEHWKNPKNWGIMNDADGYGKVTGPCGDTMEFSIKVKDNVIISCTFDTDGCGTTIACASIITEMVTNKPISYAKSIAQNSVLDACGGLPEDTMHCATLAANTLHATIENYEETKSHLWKKLYRK
ncbi:MAG: iron-sulfur cluster assembly scaffold protein [bacterium]